MRTPSTPEEFARHMKEVCEDENGGDIEDAADVMARLLEDLGYSDGVAEYYKALDRR